MPIEEAISADLERNKSRLGESLQKPPAKPPLTEEGIFEPQVYWRGALAVHALREELGDEAFFDFLISYVETYSDDNITTEEFIEFTNSEAGRNLDDLFETWLFEDGLPESLGSIDLSEY